MNVRRWIVVILVTLNVGTISASPSKTAARKSVASCISRIPFTAGKFDWLNSCEFPIWVRWQETGYCPDYACALKVPAKNAAVAPQGGMGDIQFVACRAPRYPEILMNDKVRCVDGADAAKSAKEYTAQLIAGGSPPSPSRKVALTDVMGASAPVSISSKCPTHFVEQKSDNNGDYAILNSSYIDTFIDEFKATKSDDPEKTAALAVAYRECAGEALKEVRRADHNLFTSFGVLSQLVGDGPSIIMSAALSELYAPRRADQNPVEAARLANLAFAEYAANMNNVRQELARQADQLEQEYTEAKQKEESRFEADQRSQAFGALVGGLLLKKYAGAPANYPQRMMQNALAHAESFHEYRVNILNRSNSNLNQALGRVAELPVPSALSDDGVRLHVLRIYGWPYYSGPTNSRHDHTMYIVRVKSNSGSCSGAIVGPRLILTAQHCIRDENGNYLADDLSVAYEYLTIDGAAGLVSTEFTATVTDWTSSSGFWKNSWANDWAFLVLDKPLIKDFGYLQALNPSNISNDDHISLAGYSSDLDKGSYITMDWGCTIQSINANAVLEHRCKTFHGASGSPIVVSEGSNKGKILAIESYGYDSDASHSRGGGPDSSQFYNTWVSMLRAQQ